ncbi:MAG: ATP-binding cassette domain-containing protein [Bacteroidaceae bacterium]|nr:ATP-binding cassette domain-containing protein [Bacteroidaceae bacterium]
MTSLLVQEATLSYDGKVLFSDLNLELQAGELIGISGKSGCGKTSLLRAILGFTPLQAGSIEVCGYSIEPANMDAVRRCVAYLPQDLHLAVSSVNELLDATLGLRHHSARHKELMQRAFGFCSQLGLDRDQLDTIEVSKLSGGQRQRVLLAAALAAPAPLLLLDEPTSALDAHNAQVAADLIQQVCCDEQRAAIVVSHNVPLPNTIQL